MKRFAFLTLSALLCTSTIFAQTKDSVLSEMLVNGVWQKYLLDVTTREADCNATTQLELAWNESTQLWVNSFLSTYTIDNTNDNIKVVQQSWDAINNTWVNYSRSILFHSNNGKKVTYTYEIWDAGSNTFIGNYRIIDEFDNTGKAIVNEFDNFSDGQWQKVQRGLLQYNENGYVIDNIFQVWTNNAWVNNGRTVSSYDANGKSVQYYWSTGTQSWIKTSRTFNTYIDGTAISTQSLGQFLSGTEWQNNFRSQTVYNDANFMLSSFQQNWDATLGTWVKSSRVSNDYYPDNRQHHFMFEGWDAASNTWAYGYRSKSTDLNCTQSVQLIPVAATKNNTGLMIQNEKGALPIASYAAGKNK